MHAQNKQNALCREAASLQLIMAFEMGLEETKCGVANLMRHLLPRTNDHTS